MGSPFDVLFENSKPLVPYSDTVPPQAPKEDSATPTPSEPEKPATSDPKKPMAKQKKEKEPEMTESEKAEAKKYADEITEDATDKKSKVGNRGQGRNCPICKNGTMHGTSIHQVCTDCRFDEYVYTEEELKKDVFIQKKTPEPPEPSKRKELEDMVALMVYEMDMNADSAVLLVEKMKIGLDMVQDITMIEKTMPPDCVEIMQETTAIIEGYTRKKDPTTNPADVVASQRMAIGFKHRLGEIGAYYKANSLGMEAQYYGLRGALFVGLREIGHNLETNIKKGKTVTDIENQAQMLTIPMMKQRVYATWVWERINNQLRTLSEVIKNMDSYTMELRAQRREDSLPQR